MNKPEIAEALRALPQFQRIAPEDAQRWISAVADQEPHRLLWRIQRLASLGGSDMGTLLLEAMGHSAPFQTGADIINERLMRSVPTPPLYHMKKGIRLEDVVVEAIMRLYGGRFDVETETAFRNVHDHLPKGLDGNIDFPWITNKGQRVLIDIKVPMAGVILEETKDWRKDFLYSVQLNSYQLLTKHKGVAPFDRICNCHLELPPVLTDAYYKRLSSGDAGEKARVVDEIVNLLKHQMPGLRLNFQEHPINPEIEINGRTRPMFDVIKDIAALNWQCVLDGHAPEAVFTTDAPQEGVDTLMELEDELFQLEVLNNKTAERIESIRSRISDITRNFSGANNLSQSGYYNIKTTTRINEDKLIGVAQRYQLDLNSLREDRESISKTDYDLEALIEYVNTNPDLDASQFLKPANFDVTKTQNALLEKGLAPQTVLETGVRIGRSTKKQVREALEQLAPSCEAALNNAISHIEQSKTQQQQTETASPATAAVISR